MSHTKDRDREEVEAEEEKRPYGFFEQKAAMRALHFYISGEIEEPSKYTDMVHQIRIANPNDAVHIHLNTPGGQIATGIQIINAVRASQGHVVTHLEGEVCSMGSLLFLIGDEMVAYDNSLLMFHNYSGGSYGKGHELRAGVDAVDIWCTDLLRQVTEDFLAKSEVDRIIRGEDLWMQSKEVKERLVKMITALEKKEAAKKKKKPQTKKVSTKKSS